MKAPEESASLPAHSTHAAPTATDLYRGDDGSVAPASGLTGSDAATAASGSSGASQSAQNGNSSPTDLNPIDDAAGAGSQAATASTPTTITGSIGGLAAGGATTAVAGAIGPLAAQTDPSASMAASAAGATVTSPAATGSSVNSLVVTPDRGLRVTGPAEVSQAANHGDMVAANGGLVSNSSVDAAAAASQARLSLDESAKTDGLAEPLDGAGLLTRPADLLTEFLPFDRASVENAIDQFLERFEGMGGGLFDRPGVGDDHERRIDTDGDRRGLDRDDRTQAQRTGGPDRHGGGVGEGARPNLQSDSFMGAGTLMSTASLDTLLEKLAKGESAAAERVFRDFEPFLRAMVRRRLTPPLRVKFDSMDVVQSVWTDILEAARGRAEIQGPSYLGGSSVKWYKLAMDGQLTQVRCPEQSSTSG